MVCLEICLAILGLAVLIYKWSTATHNAFDGRGVYFEKPRPFFGNMGASILFRTSFQKQLSKLYNRTKQYKIVGLFSFRTPMIQLNDPEIIKKICIKDFDHFPNHPSFIQSNERLLNDMLSMMTDQRWKHMRNTLTPVFTAAKMRSMFALMDDSFGECLEHLSGLSKGSKSGEGIELDMKVLCNKLSNDLIATTAFGLKVNSFETPDNEFYRIGQSLTFSRGSQLFKFMLSIIVPKVFLFFNLKIFNGQKVEYFVRLVVDAMKYREEHNINRPDMIQLLMESKKENENNWTDDEIVAQCFIFFFAAFENNANLICTTSLELLENPDIQQRLYEEVKEIQESLKGGSLTYDAVQKMKYMDMVISESLRKWTLAAATDRLCSKDYTLTDEDGTKLFDFKVGDRVNIPIVGLHWDDQYFPEPRKFDPERFSDERKNDLVPYTYLPFGVGPRNCIGNRYALMQVKGMLYNLLIRYKIERSPKTVKDLWEEARGFNLAPKAGYWMRLVPRKQIN
ncbi:cytochrome P450 9b2-like [Drosophila obscura]|uniref:cytochrome P450 9b2-like n=1 Tax=Drosophila obscura TaxID=7282 RepID=UPI001BB2BC5B|nr:cytochrome P450 9b2-like [Drosophila obscura]